MPRIPIIMPQLGESIAEATIVNLLVQPGEQVNSDQDLVEVETNKATMNVTSPASGEVVEFTVEVNESYSVGAVLGYLEVSIEETEKELAELEALARKNRIQERLAAIKSEMGK